MRHSKILKRPDGSRVRINVELLIDRSYNQSLWSFTVDTCDKGKRTWQTPAGTSKLRILDRDKLQNIREESLRRASSHEIQAVMFELWEALRPSILDVV
jgi:hypothetical protein